MSVRYVYIFVDPKRFVGAVELDVLKEEDFNAKVWPLRLLHFWILWEWT